MHMIMEPSKIFQAVFAWLAIWELFPTFTEGFLLHVYEVTTDCNRVLSELWNSRILVC